MKQTNPKTHSARYAKKALHHAKRRVRDSRPLHRTLAFHPITFLFLLCAGVLLCVSTFSVAAASYSVHGEVLAPIPAAPAIITSPSDNQQLSPQVQMVSGTCPNDTYVKVSDNSALSGIGVCDQNGTFQVSVSLSSGLNVLTAQVYNVTDNPGPSSSPVDVYYYPPVPPSPIPAASSPNGTANPASTFVSPITVNLLQVDRGIPFNPAKQPQLISYKPTLTGTAPPYSLVLITIHTNPYYCRTYANAQGYWSCTFNQTIPTGIHTVEVQAQTTSKQIISLPYFHIQITSSQPKSQSSSPKFSISTTYAYQVYALNQPVKLNLDIVGGTPPFAFSVTWGDGVMSTYVRSDVSSFSISHAYTKLNKSFGTVPIKIAAVDTNGNFSSLQIDTVLRNPGFVANTNKPTSGSGFLSSIRPWLTVLWPGYVVILLMVFSFWLGERQEMIALLNGKKLPSRRQHRHSH